MKLSGKTALVTGGASGIGEGIVRRFVAEGAAVLIADLDRVRGRALEAELTGAGHRVRFVATDVAERVQCDAAVADAVAFGGALNVVVNNAGRNFFHTVETTTDEEWETCIAVDLRSAFYVTRAAAPHLSNSGGAIINVASSHGERTLPNRFPYAAAKAGVLGMTRSTAIDLGPKGIRVNAIIPGYILTPQSERHLDPSLAKESALAHARRGQAIRRTGLPEDVANLALFLASDDASFITGQSIWIDGGRGVTLP